MDQMDHELLEKQFKKLENVLTNIYNSISSTKSTGWFSSETTNLLNVVVEIKNKIDKFLDTKNQPAMNNINFEKASITELKDYISKMLVVIKNLQQDYLNSVKEINNTNSLILKSIRRLEQQNSLNVIDSAFINANSEFVNIVTNYRQKNLTFEEAHYTLEDIKESLLDLIENNQKNEIISMEKRNYYVELYDKFFNKCKKFADSCGLAERKTNNNKNL